MFLAALLAWAPPPHVPSLFGLYAANIGKAHPPQIQPTHVIASIDENMGSTKPLGPEQSGGAIGQATGEASADGKFLYTLNDIYDGTAVTARIEKYDLPTAGPTTGAYTFSFSLFEVDHFEADAFDAGADDGWEEDDPPPEWAAPDRVREAWAAEDEPPGWAAPEAIRQ